MGLEKPPVARMRAGGFSRLYKRIVFLALAAAGALLAASPAMAGYGFSLGRPMVYLRPGTHNLPIVYGWNFTGVWNEGNVNKGIHVELFQIDDYGYYVDSVNIGVVYERQAGRVLAGVGGGLLDSRFPAPAGPMKSVIVDVYGKATILSAGRGSLRGFITARWMDPIPFSARFIYNAGLEVCLDLQ